ncbi:MAG TPA: type II toxin-antitoxin system Phd/YefM family antitoxin [Desulfobacterales bacterium]|nr:type II toxin-antitoxin system Phd/YefM family antitoxin [Desulfobacterales bacterium]
MNIAPVAEGKGHFSTYLKRCEEGPVIITRNGRPVAVLIAALEEELERLVPAHTPKFRRLLDAARERIQQRGGVEHEDFWQSVETSGPSSGESGPL